MWLNKMMINAMWKTEVNLEVFGGSFEGKTSKINTILYFFSSKLDLK